MKGKLKYLLMVCIWVCIFKGAEALQYQEWYRAAFGVWQALGSTIIAVSAAVLLDIKKWQVKGLLSVLILQIVVALLWQAGWDYEDVMKNTIFYVSSDLYIKAALNTLNPLEALLLLSIPAAAILNWLGNLLKTTRQGIRSIYERVRNIHTSSHNDSGRE